MAKTKVMACDCHNEQQDVIHGRGNRVFNATFKDKEYRCTGCGKTKLKGEDGVATPVKKKK